VSEPRTSLIGSAGILPALSGVPAGEFLGRFRRQDAGGYGREARAPGQGDDAVQARAPGEVVG